MPGRLRIRTRKGAMGTSAAAAVVASIATLGGLVKVARSAATGGILLEFDPEVVELAEIIAALEAANVVLDIGLHVSEAVLALLEARASPSIAEAAHREHEYLHGLDMVLHKATGGAASLKGLLPFVLISVLIVALRHGWLGAEGLRELVERFRG